NREKVLKSKTPGYDALDELNEKKQSDNNFGGQTALKIPKQRSRKAPPISTLKMTSHSAHALTL
ncbi:hypothetical protein ACTHRR_11975, partial [Neisseria sp. P0003.S003]|uniref:hypothetical protein n=1 Tax=Neisseria sp. P0003.S003 TaxID=3436658 RepID=UPI003F7F3969